MIYKANYEAAQALIGFLIQDCCSGEFASIRQDNKTGCSIIELANICPPATPAEKKRRKQR